ncbi:hypothetical protein [Methanosalsum natronophilum]|uniref:hypothetical protein n=1 Tax=Methanosalsum natronophilum TaxID=768733 RepID=UPI00216952F8|nr:hypothetical protein [Methanosalsum natronophilum]MCS3924901.1 hypothetical protein [Methanosalsum natronophilum]
MENHNSTLKKGDIPMPEIRKLQRSTKGQYWLGMPMHLVRLCNFEKGQPFFVTIENNKIIIAPAAANGHKPTPAAGDN